MRTLHTSLPTKPVRGSSTCLIRYRAHLFCALLAACTGSIGDGADPGGVPDLPSGTADPTGIPLVPPPAVGTRAAECEADYAPLRRLNHREYRRTLEALFGDIVIPATPVGTEERRGSFTNNYQALTNDAVRIRNYLDNAIAVAAEVTPVLIAQVDCSPDMACFSAFIRDFGLRAFRRPVTADEEADFAAIFVASGDYELAVEMAVAAFLQAPSFLYRPEFGQGAGTTLTQHEIAARLSYFLWASMPDDELFASAAADDLHDDALRTQVERMMRDPQARDGLLAATGEWFNLERLRTLLKGEDDEWTAEVRDDLRESLELFLWERAFSADGTLTELFTSRGAYVNSTIDHIFGLEIAGTEFAWHEFDERSGVLTHPAILATYAHGSYPSPVLRGVFILSEVLCDPPSPPPAGIAMEERPDTSSSGEALTNRQGYVEQTESDAACVYCHQDINPLGFAFENFDAIGAHRTMDNGFEVDASGASNGFTLGESFEFEDARELNTQLGQSERVRACIVDRWVRYASGGGSLAFDPCVREDLLDVATQPEASLRDIVIAIALHPSFSAAAVIEQVPGENP